jgi:putative transposase
LAEKRRRFGCRRLHLQLYREGLVVNHKRRERLYREERLSLRVRKRKKMASVGRVQLPKAEKPNHLWAMDFMQDALHDGRRIRVLVILDLYTRENLRIEVDSSIGGHRVAAILSQVSAMRGLPEYIVVDNGPEFISNAMDAWAYTRGVTLQFIRPGKPVDNAFVESFNGKFRDECLNQNWFISVEQARRVIEEWRKDYNEERPHSSLGDLTPCEFMRLSVEQGTGIF